MTQYVYSLPTNDIYTLKSGREVYANRGIFGLIEWTDGSFKITMGYDSEMEYYPWNCLDDDDEPLTINDLTEIADMTIDRWTRFRKSLGDK